MDPASALWLVDREPHSIPPPDHGSEPPREVLPGFVGQSEAVREALKLVSCLAPTDASILITGESGTGKEILAQAIHALSLRGARLFIPVNCGSLALELMANELFGHEQGAYTGAARSFGGLVAQAEGGTLFLDEIDSIPVHGQVKLLRFLQEGETRAVGASRLGRADVRLIFATNSNLRQRVEDGRLREDFFYRLGPIHLHLPPLRDRTGDVPLLAQHFLSKYSRKYGKVIDRFSPEAMQCLSSFDWPGNVRQLEHQIERAVLVCSSEAIQVQDLQLDGQTTVAMPKSFQERRRTAMEQADKRECKLLLARHNGSVTQAALEAGMDYRNFSRLLRKHGLK